MSRVEESLVESEERKLKFGLVPDGCWGFNLSHLLTRKAWEVVRKDAKIRSLGKCAICGAPITTFEAHEVWSYNEKKGIQKLEDVIAICRDCHMAIHIDRTALKGNLERAEEHYMKVNNVSYSQMKLDLKLAHEEHKRRNLVSEWSTDFTWLRKLIEK